MRITRSSRRRRLGATTVLVGAALVMLGLMASPAMAGGAFLFGPGYDVYLNPDHRGSTAAGAENGEACPENALVDGMASWHFVLPGSDHDFETLDVAFSTDADPDPEILLTGLTPKSDFTGFDVTKNYLASPTGKHAYVYTSGDAAVTLLDGAAHVTPNATLDKFNLSHACAGSTGGDDEGGDDTVQATSGSTDTPTEQTDTEVEGEVIVPQQLPATGSEDRSLLVLGIGCIAIGSVVLVARRAVSIR